MLRLRPYKACDAKYVVTWIKDQYHFRQWCADRMNEFPLTIEELNGHYHEMEESDSFWPMTAFDETGVVGHFIMRFTDDEKKSIRLGFVIVDDTKRGKGYGKEMLKLAFKYAFELLMVDEVTLGVFENNEPAHYCYRAAGFEEIPMADEEYYEIFGKKWKCLEMRKLKDK